MKHRVTSSITKVVELNPMDKQNTGPYRLGTMHVNGLLFLTKPPFVGWLAHEQHMCPHGKQVSLLATCKHLTILSANETLTS